MDNGTRKRLRELAAALRETLGEAGERAWPDVMGLALEAAQAARGIGGTAPDFFAGGGVVSPAAAERCREILTGNRELFVAPASLGWLHQFWQSGVRSSLAGRTRADQSAKIGAATVAPATQIFSEDYMVAFLTENSLGALWAETHPASPLVSGWSYYVRPPATGTAGRLSVREMTVCDPACGAGNFLLAAFDMLYAMYHEEEGGEPAAICAAIVNGNLFGMDIDVRAAAVTRASLWLRARELAPDLDSAALTGLRTNIAAGGGELGSLLMAEEAPGPLKRLLARRYAVVVTNPPYLDKRDYAKSVRTYLRRHYAAGAGNLYTAFIVRCLAMADRFAAMVTPQTFLFIRSYAALRREVFGRAAVRTLAHLGLGAFADAVVDAALFVLDKEQAADAAGVYFKLLAAPQKAEALAAAVAGYKAGERHPEVFVRSLAGATALPGGPLAYWLGDGLGAAVAAARPLQETADVVLGMKTADNTRFVRRWWEVWQPGGDPPGWVPYEKEASGFRYARPAAHYVRWTAAAQDYYRTYYSAQLPNPRYWFREGIAYGLISSKAFTAKMLPPGHMTDMAASCVFPRDPADIPFLLGLLNAKIYRWLLTMFNPTVNYQPVDLQRLPLPPLPGGEREEIARLAMVAADAAAELRAAEITDCGYRFSPEDWLPLAEKMPARLLGFWRAALRSVLAADAIDRCLAAALSLPAGEAAAIDAELGCSPGLSPALAGYEGLPVELAGDCLPAPAVVMAESVRTAKERLRDLYTVGPRKGELPEDFFASLAADTGLHPVSVYNLLAEGIGEGWRCLTLERELAADFAGAAVLSLLGHSWPGQEPAADQGILTLAEARAALAGLIGRYTDWDAFADEFASYTGLPPAAWLEKRFFRRHAARFKRRPIVWQLVRGPKNYLFHWRRAGDAARLGGLKDYDFSADWGVRVNVAPLQAAGLLAAPVLAAGDLPRALADGRRCRDGDYVL